MFFCSGTKQKPKQYLLVGHCEFHSFQHLRSYWFLINARLAWLLATLWTSPLSFLTETHTCLCSQVDVFGLGVRDTVPTAADGRTLQTSLQHLWQFIRLSRCVLRQNDWRRADAWVVSHDSLPWMGRRTSIVSLPNHGYAHVSHYTHHCVLGHQVRNANYAGV